MRISMWLARTSTAPLARPRPPLHVGGASVKHTLPLVARYADVWNVPTYALGRLDELQAALDTECARIGRDPSSIRRSLQAVLVVATPERLSAAEALARKRFGGAGFGLDAGGFIGSPERVADRIADLQARGFSSFMFFTFDRAATETLELFASEVMSRFRGRRDAVRTRDDDHPFV